MRAAGIRTFSGPVELLELAEPAVSRPDEVLIDVHSSGVGNWDDIARAGGWDLGRRPPMALGVAAAGVVAAAGAGASGLTVGDRVMTHSLPLRGQGAWAESFVAAATDVAGIPAAVAFNVAAAAVVPMLTADQALGGLPGSGRGASLLIHGAGGVTGLVLVQLAAHLGAEVIATAGSRSASRVAAAGAAHVLDSRSAQWPGQVRTLTGDRGVDLAVNALPGGAATAIGAVRDGGRLATITSDAPAAERRISVSEVYVAPDGPLLSRLGQLLAAGLLRVEVAAAYRLEDAAAALARVRQGTSGRAIVLETRPSLPGLAPVIQVREDQARQ